MKTPLKTFIFLFFLLIFFSSTAAHLSGWDGMIHYLFTENLVIHKSLELHYDLPGVEELEFKKMKGFLGKNYAIQNDGERMGKNIPDAMYVTTPILLSFIAAPFYVLAKATGSSAPVIVAFFTNSIITAVSATLVYALSKEIYKSDKIGFVVSILFAVTSFTWPYTDTFFLQPSAGLMLIAASYFLFKSSKNNTSYLVFLSGVFVILSVLAHPGSVIFVPGFIITGFWIFRNRLKIFSKFMVGVIGIAALQGFLNFVRFGSAFNFGYGRVGSLGVHNNVEGLYGLFFSPGYGLFANYPITVLLPIAIYYLWKKNKPLSFLIMYVIISSWLYYGTFDTPIWHGLGGWAERYLVPILPIISVGFGVLLKQFSGKGIKIAFIVLATLGFFVNVSGVLVYYQTGSDYSSQILFAEGKKPKKIIQMWEWDLQYIPVVSHWKLLFSDYEPSPSHLSSLQLFGKPCLPDIWLYCNWGVFPLSIVLVFVAFLGFLILRDIRKEQTKILL